MKLMKEVKETNKLMMIEIKYDYLLIYFLTFSIKKKSAFSN